MASKTIHTMITAFRDGLQSYFGARVFTKDIMPAIEAAHEAGFKHFEIGGGARFQSLYFYTNEDAFAMKAAIRLALGPQAKLQTLARGVSVVGLDFQPKDVIELHAKLFAKHGVSHIRNFDALNDVGNLIDSGRAIKRAGMHHEITVTLMEPPPGAKGAHSPEYYESVLRQILDSGVPFDSVCFKDASGTSVPHKVHETVRRARKLLPDGSHIVFHTHDTAGLSIAAYLAAIEAGADQVDLSLAPVSHGTAQPDVLSMWQALRGSDYRLDVDIDKVMEVEAQFKESMSDYFFPPEAQAVEPLIPLSPMPGGAMTANTQMMRDNQIMDRYPEVLNAMGEVVQKGGLGTSVTPVSQFYFQQAFNNVMLGPWQRIAEGYGRMVLGYFGKTPVAPDPEVVRLASEQLELEPTERHPVELAEDDPDKGLEAAARRLDEAGLIKTEENLFIAATCKEKGIAYLKGDGPVLVRKKADEDKKAAPPPRPVSAPPPQVGQPSAAAPAPAQAACCPRRRRRTYHRPEDHHGAPALAEMPGRIVRICVHEGDQVVKGQSLMVLESMLLELEVHAPEAGRVTEILVHKGDQVGFQHLLALID